MRSRRTRRPPLPTGRRRPADPGRRATPPPGRTVRATGEMRCPDAGVVPVPAGPVGEAGGQGPADRRPTRPGRRPTPCPAVPPARSNDPGGRVRSTGWSRRPPSRTDPAQVRHRRCRGQGRDRGRVRRPRTPPQDPARASGPARGRGRMPWDRLPLARKRTRLDRFRCARLRCDRRRCDRRRWDCREPSSPSRRAPGLRRRGGRRAGSRAGRPATRPPRGCAVNGFDAVGSGAGAHSSAGAQFLARVGGLQQEVAGTCGFRGTGAPVVPGQQQRLLGPGQSDIQQPAFLGTVAVDRTRPRVPPAHRRRPSGCRPVAATAPGVRPGRRGCPAAVVRHLRARCSPW